MMYFCRKNLVLLQMVYSRFIVIWMFKLLMWAVIISLAWMTFSCEEFCEEPNRTAVVINFFGADDAPVKIKDVRIRGVENDSVLYDPNTTSLLFGGKDFSQVLLPVNPTANSMSFTIRNDTFPVDTIILRYSRHIGFISSQCGCVTFAEIQEEPERTQNTIRYIEVTNPSVTTVSYRQGIINAENIRIYY